MEIRLSQTMGYCRGVSRALAMAEQAIETARQQGKKIYSLGKLIHNPQVNERLASLGLHQIKDPFAEEAGVVVIRAHGISDEVRQRYLEAGHELVDATCPVVKHNLRRIAHYSKTHEILIVGHVGHPETLAMQGVQKDGKLCQTRLITSVDEVGQLVAGKHYAIFVQTTFDERGWKEITERLSSFGTVGSELLFVNNVCSSSVNRRNALLELAEECDAIVVIGGKASANTRALYHLALESGVKAWHIEDEREILSEMFDYAILGITAGASTPTEIIDRVIARFQKE